MNNIYDVTSIISYNNTSFHSQHCLNTFNIHISQRVFLWIGILFYML